MDLALLVNILTAATLMTGFFFAAYEWRRSRSESRRQSEVLLLRSYESPEFAKGMRLIMDLPDGLNREAIEAALNGDEVDLLWQYAVIMESLGYLVFRRQVDMRLVDQTMGGPVIITWRKLRLFADDFRRESGRDTMYEWFQWLADRLSALEHKEGRTPAYLRERDWQP
jgi:hypothetical protein